MTQTPNDVHALFTHIDHVGVAVPDLDDGTAGDQGRVGGRKPKLTAQQVGEIREAVQSGRRTAAPATQAR